VVVGTRRVIAGVNGSVRSLAALRAGAAEARSSGAELLPVLAWTPAGGEVAYIRCPCPALLQVWEQDARDRLHAAVGEAFGGVPGGLVVHPVIVRGAPGPSLVWVAGRSGDLLVVGCGGWGRLGRAVHGSVSRYCLAHARCPVLAVPAPEMIRELRSRHRWRPEDFAAPRT
jgi:nucleotide-binding universal stress UspA family protein